MVPLSRLPGSCSTMGQACMYWLVGTGDVTLPAAAQAAGRPWPTAQLATVRLRSPEAEATVEKKPAGSGPGAEALLAHVTPRWSALCSGAHVLALPRQSHEVPDVNVTSSARTHTCVCVQWCWCW